MLCSNCSRHVKPVVAFDIDGVLADYHGNLAFFTGCYMGDEVLGSNLMQYDGSMTHGEWFEKCGISREQFRQIKLAYRQGGQKRTQTPHRSVIDCVQKTHNYGVEVWVTTTRPYLRLDNVDPDTRWWIERYDVPFDHMLYDDVKYQTLAQMVDRARVVAIVDDQSEQYDDAYDLFGPGVPILYKSRYNADVVRAFSAQSGRELWQMVGDRIDQWRRHYG